ncbi:MAG: Nre family DNA repair protein [Halobacteria archaeon]
MGTELSPVVPRRPGSQLIPASALLSPREAEEVFHAGGEAICVACKGAHLLCGKERCPILTRLALFQAARPLFETTELAGATPPGVFVGRMGYPKVTIGPLVPPVGGDTTILDMPEQWLGKPIEEIASMRFSLVRGKIRVNACEVETSGRLVDMTRELAMAASPADIEAEFTRKPAGKVVVNEDSQPFGPSAPLKALDLGDLKVDQRIEKRYGDTDLKAKGAVLDLYRDGLPVSRIQRSFSAGLFGLKKNRHFVPTRWSITAVDNAIGLDLVAKVKRAPEINEFRIYEAGNLDNRFLVLMLPMAWSYELIEAWYPNTLWNPLGRRTVIFGDCEFYEGRTTYAQIGGCYYAARLAVGECLTKENRQARVVILREAHPGYIMPVGVWNVRETVREALRHEPRRFDRLSEALAHVTTRLDIPLGTWIRHSGLLRDVRKQRRLVDFAEKKESLRNV